MIALMSARSSKDAPRRFWMELRKELYQGLTEIDRRVQPQRQWGDLWNGVQPCGRLDLGW